MRDQSILPIVSALLLLTAIACDPGTSPKEVTQATAATPPAAPVEVEKPAPPEPPKPETFGGEFCETIVPCYQKMEFNGNFAAEVSVDIEPDGSVAAASFTGEAPKPIQTCIVDAIKAIKLDPYNGKPGRTRCTQSGQLSGGTQMVMADSAYEIRQ
jgi:hypothetical protein